MVVVVVALVLVPRCKQANNKTNLLDCVLMLGDDWAAAAAVVRQQSWWWSNLLFLLRISFFFFFSFASPSMTLAIY